MLEDQRCLGVDVFVRWSDLGLDEFLKLAVVLSRVFSVRSVLLLAKLHRLLHELGLLPLDWISWIKLRLIAVLWVALWRIRSLIEHQLA